MYKTLRQSTPYPPPSYDPMTGEVLWVTNETLLNNIPAGYKYSLAGMQILFGWKPPVSLYHVLAHADGRTIGDCVGSNGMSEPLNIQYG